MSDQSSMPKGESDGSRNQFPPVKPDSSAWIIIAFFYLFCVLISTWFQAASQTDVIPYSRFLSLAGEGKIDEVVITKEQVMGKYKTPGKFKAFVSSRMEDPQLAQRLSQEKITFEAKKEDGFVSMLPWIITPIIFIAFMNIIASKAGGKDGIGFGLSSIEKNKARVYMEKQVKASFADVAGLVEAKEELAEVVGFLKEPSRYNRLGGHLPKGILLVGPPGTGKTLLARAIAGEAGVPFFSISGSEFVELFVGVGAARVRDLFAQAQKNAPCIIFIDELDALGRARGLGSITGAHDEKEQTLNQLLVEMDGFDPRQGVVLLAATNRPEILDSALLRAGRFDRHVLVDRPDKLDRIQILKVHTRNIVCDTQLDLEEIASSTAGFTGADLANLANEASLLANRRGAASVETRDFVAALERVVAGLEKRNRLLNPRERTVVAYHETGHALTAMSLPGTDPVQKISIIPRGIGSLGYTMQTPTEDRFLMTRAELKNKLAVLLGGRAAELLVFEDVSTGAADDLAKATEIARSMVTRYGMTQELGPVCYESEQSGFLPNQAGFLESKRLYSEESLKKIDLAVRTLVTEALDLSLNLLQERRTLLEAAAKLLLQKENLTRQDLLGLIKSYTQSKIDESSQQHFELLKQTCEA